MSFAPSSFVVAVGEKKDTIVVVRRGSRRHDLVAIGRRT